MKRQIEETLPSVIRGGITGRIARHKDDRRSLRHIAETQGLASSAVFGRCTADQGACKEIFFRLLV
jgi:hypothetical protein